ERRIVPAELRRMESTLLRCAGSLIDLEPGPAELVNDELPRRDRLTRESDQTCMMGEEHHLHVPRDFGKDGEGRRGPLVVELNEHVIEHDRHGLAHLGTAKK